MAAHEADRAAAVIEAARETAVVAALPVAAVDTTDVAAVVAVAASVAVAVVAVATVDHAAAPMAAVAAASGSLGPAMQRLPHLLRERGRDRDGRHRAHEQERCDDQGLPRLRVLDQRREHAVVVAERRVDVDQRDDRRGLFERLLPEDHLGHCDGVHGVRAGGDRTHERLVREGQEREDQSLYESNEQFKRDEDDIG